MAESTANNFPFLCSQKRISKASLLISPLKISKTELSIFCLELWHSGEKHYTRCSHSAVSIGNIWPSYTTRSAWQPQLSRLGILQYVLSSVGILASQHFPVLCPGGAVNFSCPPICQFPMSAYLSVSHVCLSVSFSCLPICQFLMLPICQFLVSAYICLLPVYVVPIWW